jgi:hypothetical protein
MLILTVSWVGLRPQHLLFFIDVMASRLCIEEEPWFEVDFAILVAPWELKVWQRRIRHRTSSLIDLDGSDWLLMIRIRPDENA